MANGVKLNVTRALRESRKRLDVPVSKEDRLMRAVSESMQVLTPRHMRFEDEERVDEGQAGQSKADELVKLAQRFNDAWRTDPKAAMDALRKLQQTAGELRQVAGESRRR